MEEEEEEEIEAKKRPPSGINSAFSCRESNARAIKQKKNVCHDLEKAGSAIKRRERERECGKEGPKGKGEEEREAN